MVDSQIAGDSDYNKAYQDCFYSNFNWAVLENSLKWNNMEEEQVKTPIHDAQHVSPICKSPILVSAKDKVMLSVSRLLLKGTVFSN